MLMASQFLCLIPPHQKQIPDPQKLFSRHSSFLSSPVLVKSLAYVAMFLMQTIGIL